MSQNFFPSKRLGQNFLNNPDILRRICSYGELHPDDHVIEIGPGFGSLTNILCAESGHVTAIEKDVELYKHLSGTMSGIMNLELLQGDILKYDFKDFYSGKKLKLVSNLPYNISSPVLFKLISERDIFSLIVIMLQKELAERIASRPGSRIYGSLSVIAQTFFNIIKVMTVPSSAFKPKPKVDSAVLQLTSLEEPPAHIQNIETYLKVVRSSFSSRRKMLPNSLVSGFSRDIVNEAIERSGIYRKRRAETLTIPEFARLSNEIYFLQQSTSNFSRSF